MNNLFVNYKQNQYGLCFGYCRSKALSFVQLLFTKVNLRLLLLSVWIYINTLDVI